MLVADDHPVVRGGLSALVEDHPRMRLVAEAETGAQAVALAVAHRPDVILMDLRMPEMGGVEAIRAIRSAWPNARVIVLTTYDGDEDIYQALQAGARAYLLKDASRAELLEAVEAVHRGETRIPPEVGAKLAERVAGPDLPPASWTSCARSWTAAATRRSAAGSPSPRGPSSSTSTTSSPSSG